MIKKLLAIVLATALTLSMGLVPAMVAAETPYTEDWDGTRGLDSEQCWRAGEPGRPETGWIHWIFSTKGASTGAELVLGGTGVGTYLPGNPLSANVWHFYTPYFELDGLTATIELSGGAPGPGGGLVLSDYCPGNGIGGTQATLSIIKFYDANGNGVLDPGEPELDGWYFDIGGLYYDTPFSETVSEGTYNIVELMPDACSDCGCYWVASGITVDDLDEANYTIDSNTEVEVTLEDGDEVTIYFGNYCLCPSGGFSPGYWSQVNLVYTGKGKSRTLDLANSQSRRISGDLYNAFVGYLNDNPVTLVNNDDSPAAFTNALELSQYIGSGLNAANMAAQLSRHTAAMILNILSGEVDGNAFYLPAEMTVQGIVNAAKAFLNGNPIVTEPGELRDEAEQLKDWLDELNNGDDVIPVDPCGYTFTFDPEP